MNRCCPICSDELKTYKSLGYTCYFCEYCDYEESTNRIGVQVSFKGEVYFYSSRDVIELSKAVKEAKKALK